MRCDVSSAEGVVCSRKREVGPEGSACCAVLEARKRLKKAKANHSTTSAVDVIAEDT